MRGFAWEEKRPAQILRPYLYANWRRADRQRFGRVRLAKSSGEPAAGSDFADRGAAGRVVVVLSLGRPQRGRDFWRQNANSISLYQTITYDQLSRSFCRFYRDINGQELLGVARPGRAGRAQCSRHHALSGRATQGALCWSEISKSDLLLSGNWLCTKSLWEGSLTPMRR